MRRHLVGSSLKITRRFIQDVEPTNSGYMHTIKHVQRWSKSLKFQLRQNSRHISNESNEAEATTYPYETPLNHKKPQDRLIERYLKEEELEKDRKSQDRKLNQKIKNLRDDIDENLPKNAGLSNTTPIGTTEEGLGRLLSDPTTDYLINYSIMDVMMSKSRVEELITVCENDTVFECIKKMVNYKIGAVVVIPSQVEDANPSENSHQDQQTPQNKDVGKLEGVTLCGIFTERDYMSKVFLRGLSSTSTSVKDVMSTNVVTVTLGNTCSSCMKIMTERKIRHLPVVNKKGQVIDIVSIGDIVRFILMEQRHLISHMREYIEGSY